MRTSFAFIVAVSAALVAGSASAQNAEGAKVITECAGHPNALGVARVVEIDTTGGPGFGFEHFKAYDFLRDKEVVLTFDDGPWPGHTPMVLKALADHCTKALFFPIGNTGPALMQIAEAKKVCRRCEVREACLQWALDAGQDHGVWGGLSEDERRAMKRRAARMRVRNS